ncbi:hypothetical protein WICMUC_005692 [Wickerhamomyces mucosus]|uniref:DDHD domain-containing protein n=1 Tax=Wickerhamomyces mucosus TaxID=1378264 RepID=A0A9P8T5L1_9ASCO|nr:hypothetical protein WICMUC_005692 [Wickerhamomyces mucosus]
MLLIRTFNLMNTPSKTMFYGLNLKKLTAVRFFSSKVPAVKPRWFYSTDIPTYMPKHYKYTKKEEPKKFQEFSEFDTRRLEEKYQLLEKNPDSKDFKITVNEDYLFEVDLIKRQMSPIYWEGAIYEIRRGIWFNDKIPANYQLTKELEDAYDYLKPYDKSQDSKSSSSSNPLNRKNPYYTLKGDHKEGKYVVFTGSSTASIIDDVESLPAKFQFSFLNKNQVAKSLMGSTSFTRYPEENLGTEIKENDESNEEHDSFFNKMFELELRQLFNEKSKSQPNNEDESNTKKAMKLVIENDYKTNETDGERKIDHLIFCVHGIGQNLGTKFQNVNFIHTVNILRKNVKKVYKENKDLQKLNNNKNCGIQVLPISWRHKVDFNTEKSFNENLPSLNDITVDEIKPIRNLLGSVLLDVLLYYEPHYFNQILDEVVSQINETYLKFKERNPQFNGKISLIGHSLGSAIVFDILSLQPSKFSTIKDPKHLIFKVDNFISMGSPVGVFNLLKNKQIGSVDINGTSTKDISVPRCNNFYNVFHPCDPIAYRIEPLVSPEFSKFQPESIPFLIENFNKHISSIAQISDNIVSNATKTWTTVASSTNPITKLVSKAVQDSENDNEKKSLDEKPTSKLKLSSNQLKLLTSLNHHGRVDYALQQGLLDISIIQSISSHINYFEDENIAAFILKETLTNPEPINIKTVNLIK